MAAAAFWFRWGCVFSGCEFEDLGVFFLFNLRKGGGAGCLRLCLADLGCCSI